MHDNAQTPIITFKIVVPTEHLGGHVERRPHNGAQLLVRGPLLAQSKIYDLNLLISYLRLISGHFYLLVVHNIFRF